MALPLGSEERRYVVRFVLGGLFGGCTGWSSTVLWSEEPTAGRTTGDWYQDFTLVKILPIIKSQLATVQAELGLLDPQSDRDYSIKLIASVI